MATNTIPSANGERGEPSLELRFNSVDDAVSAVQNSRAIHAEAVARGVNSLEILVAAGIEREVDRLVAGVFPLKVYFKLVSPLPGNVFFPIPHAKKFFNVPIESKDIAAAYEQVRGLLPAGVVPEKIDRRKFNRPPPRKPKAVAESPSV